MVVKVTNQLIVFGIRKSLLSITNSTLVLLVLNLTIPDNLKSMLFLLFGELKLSLLNSKLTIPLIVLLLELVKSIFKRLDLVIDAFLKVIVFFLKLILLFSYCVNNGVDSRLELGLNRLKVA